jgi:hypothetical protein
VVTGAREQRQDRETPRLRGGAGHHRPVRKDANAA